MRSRNDWPGSWVISTTMRSESTRVPPVTALRSPPDSRITGRRLAGDRRLVDRGDALDHRAVAGDHLAGLDDDDVAAAQLGGGARRRRPRSRAIVSVRIARSASACALPRPSASASARLAKTTVSHSQIATVNVNQAGSSPPPSGPPPKSWISQADGRDDGADLDHEHDRVAHLHARVELAQRGDERGAQDVGGEQRADGLVGHRADSWSRARLSSSDVHAGLAEDAEEAAVGVVVDRACATRASGSRRTRGDAVGLDARVGLRDVRVDAGGRGRHRVDRHLRARSGRGRNGRSSAR